MEIVGDTREDPRGRPRRSRGEGRQERFVLFHEPGESPVLGRAVARSQGEGRQGDERTPHAVHCKERSGACKETGRVLETGTVFKKIVRKKLFALAPEGLLDDAVLRFRVGREGNHARGRRETLDEVLQRAQPGDAVVQQEDLSAPREFVLDVKDRRWRINGEVFEMKKTNVTVQRGAKEIWELRNDRASMPHPMHLHGVPFRLLSRSGSPQQLIPSAVSEQGLTATDLGWKDTVLVWPGETVRLAVDFSHPYPGDQVYLFHCHNLEHEDQGMMVNIKVRA